MKRLFLVLSISLFVCFCFSSSFAKKSEALSKDMSQTLLIADNDADTTDKLDGVSEETNSESYETGVDESGDTSGEEPDTSYETEADGSEN